MYATGCGGYLIDEGLIMGNRPKPTDLIVGAQGNTSSCEWFVELSDVNSVILMNEIRPHSFPHVVKVQRFGKKYIFAKYCCL